MVTNSSRHDFLAFFFGKSRLNFPAKIVTGYWSVQQAGSQTISEVNLWSVFSDHRNYRHLKAKERSYQRRIFLPKDYIVGIERIFLTGFMERLWALLCTVKLSVLLCFLNIRRWFNESLPACMFRDSVGGKCSICRFMLLDPRNK